MKKDKKHGFDYYLEKEVIENYRKKPVELRLKWLYMANVLRRSYPGKIIEIQNRFRRGQ